MNYEFLRTASPLDNFRLVLLHGWGADADDLIPIGTELAKDHEYSIELVSLRAPQVNQEGSGRQWYRLFPPDWSEVPGAVSTLQRRIKDLASPKIPLEKTVLLGFSQGAAMAIDAGSDLPLAGLIGCSGYPHPSWEPSSHMPRVLLLHGRTDAIVPFVAAEKLLARFKKSDQFKVNLLAFDGGHEIPQSTLPAMKQTVKNWFSEI